MIWVIQNQNKCYTSSVKVLDQLILFENQIQTTSALPFRTQVQPAVSFLVCSLIFIEYKIKHTFRRKSYEEKNTYHFHLVSDHVHLSLSA